MHVFTDNTVQSDCSYTKAIALTIGENMHRIRLEQHMSISSISRLSALSRPLLSRIEAGTCDLRLSYVQRIADALCISPIELLGH